jgi:hypothetical protein
MSVKLYTLPEFGSELFSNVVVDPRHQVQSFTNVNFSIIVLSNPIGMYIKYYEYWSTKTPGGKSHLLNKRYIGKV